MIFLNPFLLEGIFYSMPEAFKVFIEIPQGSNEKFEYDEKSGSLKLNFVFSAVGGSASGGKDLVFPFNYGFIPGTMGGDGDQLDAIVLSAEPIPSSSVVECKPIGILKTIDRGEIDDKIICVPINDKFAKIYTDIQDLPPDTLAKWTKFYLEVARQKNKTVEIIGLRNKQEALEEISKALI